MQNIDITKLNICQMILLPESVPWRGSADRGWGEHKEVVDPCQISHVKEQAHCVCFLYFLWGKSTLTKWFEQVECKLFT